MPGDLVELFLATVPAAISISRVLRRELAAGRSPEQIEQIEFVGDTLDIASVLQWKRKNLPTADPAL